MIARPHWSYSQLAQYLRCPLQYFFERIAKLPRPFVPSGMALGSAIHKALADYHRHVQLQRDVSVDQVRTGFLAAYQQLEAERPVQYRDGDDRNAVNEQGISLLETYLNEPPPQKIVGVEQQLVVPLQNSHGDILEKPLVAIVDLLTEEADGLGVTEFKTSSRRIAESEVHTALQANCYVHAVKERYDQPASVRYTVLVKTKTPTVQRVETQRTDYDLQRLGDIFEAVDRAIAAEIFYPVESPMNCSGCPFFRPCREWKRPKMQQTS